MEEIEIKKLWQNFEREYNFDEKKEIWHKKSNEFRSFWKEKIFNDDVKQIPEIEIDKIIQILDRNAKGNTKENEAVAKAMIAQGAWRRMFNEIKEKKELKNILTSIFEEKEEKKQISNINKLYEFNRGRKNFLTGENSNAINAMSFAYNPSNHISVVSLNHRMRIIKFFGFKEAPDFEKDSQGDKIIKSNNAIINGFKAIGIITFPRAISDFLYLEIKNSWNKNPDIEEGLEEIPEDKIEQLEEKYYQKLIHRNFKKIFPEFKYYDEEYQNTHEGHYSCEVGEMDFLGLDQKGNFVVIELKVGTSDKNLGQICRYMGWVKENLCEGSQKVRGIIIGENDDFKLDYAIKIVPNVSFKRMWLELKIVNWKKDK